MKNYILILALTICTLGARAVDRVVDAAGYNGAYTTISAALTASSPGDRVLVYPGDYGGFTYSGGAIQILSAVEGQRYTVNSAINIGTLTGRLHISNMNFMGFTMQTTANNTAAQITRLTNCKIINSRIFWTYSNHNLELQNDTIQGFDGNYSYEVNMGHGNVSGCLFKGATARLYLANISNTVNNDTIRLIGNKFEDNTGTAVIASTTYAFVYAEGNYFNMNGGIGLNSDRTSLAATGGNTAINNTFYNSNPNYGMFVNSSTNSGKWNIRNNVFTGTITTNPQLYFIASPAAGTLVSYNMFKQTAANNAISGFTNDGTNAVGQATLAVNATTGALSTALGVDAGDPNFAFYDLDLTRNDVGCFGGSYSRANFDYGDAGSRVLMVTAPRVIISGGTVNVKADGLAK